MQRKKRPSPERISIPKAAVVIFSFTILLILLTFFYQFTLIFAHGVFIILLSLYLPSVYLSAEAEGKHSLTLGEETD